MPDPAPGPDARRNNGCQLAAPRKVAPGSAMRARRGGARRSRVQHSPGPRPLAPGPQLPRHA